ncbi:helix-turn-helix domain-containing protein [Vibrio parahaemolyticus]|nr:helix-turn-helix domain-containing protein [Vibrio parahaemolyticus]EGR0686859.1 helix-turn-helix domain-containing protein [Vibrio parahaemolyticus]
MTKQYKHLDIFIFEPDTFRLVLETKEIKLSHKESAVLQQLCENAMRVVNRRAILADIWGDSESSDIGLNKIILQLRRKFESIGLKATIETIPRVGYMLKLRIEIVQGYPLDHKDEIVGDESEDTTVNSQAEPKKSVRKQRTILIATAITLLTFLFVFITLQLGVVDYRSQQNTPGISIFKPHAQEQGRTLLYADNISASDHENYMELSKYVNENIRYYAIATKSSLSFINLDSKQNKIWQKTFLMDPNREMLTQIKCIANDINQYKAQPIKVKATPGMKYIRLNFYRPCKEDDAYLGWLLIQSTVKDESESMWVQDFSFTDNKGDLIFQLKRFSRAQIGADEKSLKVKSLHVDYVNQEALQLNSDFNNIFNQVTQDEVLLKSIDKQHNIYISSAFGGILYHVDRF